MQPTAFTIKSNAGILNQLVSLVNVVVPNTTNTFQVKAIWDTGATATVITDNVVKSLGLVPTGMSNVNTANGLAVQNTYIIDVVLPTGITVKDVTVTGATALSGGCEVLIGMDIIGLGDLSITNYKGTTCMSFRIPSLHEIDYVKNLNFKLTPNIPAGKVGSNITPKKKKRK
ncbi:MAG TPA: retropepsin-like aspartic protease [Hanamia sp.]|nr:retropepsin-like aspartic protease [Hanamia sp.]